MAQDSAGDAWEKLRSLPMGHAIEVTDAEGRVWSGTIVPHHDFSGERILQLKLASGYNVGVAIAPATRYRLGHPPSHAHGPTHGAASSRPTEASAKGADIALLTTGGTIASRVDYETGGVSPVQNEQEILALFPEIEADGRVRVVPVFDRLSENILPADWLLLAQAVRAAFEEGSRGVVIAHGTDTLGFTAAALSFLFPKLPGPVVLVGAQRSPDRPSSDGRSNLRAAAKVARTTDVGEVMVVMHAGVSDDRFAIHRGTRVRKMHSTRRDAFRSRNVAPLGFVEGDRVHWDAPVRPSVPGPVKVEGRFDDRGGLLWFYPGLSPERAEAFAQGLRGVVLAGTGLGHIHVAHLDWIRRATAAGVTVAMTSQCLEGAVEPFVYATGRTLVRAGVTYLGDMIPETAYVKLLWALGSASTKEEVERRLTTNVAGESGERRPMGDGA
jgi:glutamyl-tRNA(Gln) amidotransferase subunit D